MREHFCKITSSVIILASNTPKVIALAKVSGSNFECLFIKPVSLASFSIIEGIKNLKSLDTSTVSFMGNLLSIV